MFVGKYLFLSRLHPRHRNCSKCKKQNHGKPDWNFGTAAATTDKFAEHLARRRIRALCQSQKGALERRRPRFLKTRKNGVDAAFASQIVTRLPK